MANTGSWFGLPDFGVTEAIGKLIGSGTTAQGGSDIIPNSSPTPGGGGYQQQAPTQQPTQQPAGGGSSYVAPKATQQSAPSGGINQGNLSQYFPGYAGWDPAAAWGDYLATGGNGKGGSGSGGGQQDISQLISDAYAPALNALQGVESGLNTSKMGNLENVNADYAQGNQSIQNEQNDLMSNLTNQGQQLEKSGQSAYAEAVRNLNGLFQTMASRFGAGSSTGGSAGEILSQEFLRNQGKMQEQLQQGRQSLGAETTKVKNYVADKVGQLDSWKRDAIQKINDNFQSQMSEIALRRGDIEANKTNARIAALQNAVSQAQQITQREQDFKMGLAQFAVQTIQNASTRTLTPQEIAGVVNDMLGTQLSNFQSATAPGGMGMAYNPSVLGKSQDELRRAGLI